MGETHFQVEIEHFLDQLLDLPGSDFDEIVRAYDVDPAILRREIAAAIAGFKTGAGRTPAFSPHIGPLLTDAWTLGSLALGTDRIRSAAIALSLLDNDTLREAVLPQLPSLRQISRDRLRRDLKDICAAARLENETASPPANAKALARAAAGGPAPPRAEPARPAQEGKTPSLDAYTIDLTEEARRGRLDPVIGREREVRQVTDILIRRRQNNPILTGQPGVGKTAVVEGFAQRIVAGQVPAGLQDVRLLTLDLGLLQAGAGIRGEFERRLKSVIDEVKASPVPIILFIDEAHALIGAGGAEGQNDAANLLKPALARGELRTIAATTWLEYKKYFEKDPALARRFQEVKVEEPDPETAIAILHGLVDKLEDHHGVRVTPDAVADAVRLSHRYIMGRQLPDKAISVLDTACARVAVAQSSPPAAVEELLRRKLGSQQELRMLRRHEAVTEGATARADELEEDIARLDDEHLALDLRWRREAELVSQLNDLRLRLEDDEAEDRLGLSDQYRHVETELAALQEGGILVPSAVDGVVVAEVVSAWTGIPVGKMMTDEIAAMLGLEQRLKARIIGQDQALDMIARRIRTASADLAEPGKPHGVFLLVGPSGVGKTETAHALADLLYGGESKMVVINMSEYQEAHSVSNLKGAPPGYVGHGKGGVLTEAIRRRPYTVLLLDEIEKAHPDVLEMFYQVFDKGILEDSEGNAVSFKNVLILLTSNLGAETIVAACRAEDLTGDELAQLIRPELLDRLPAALLGRMVAIPYRPLGEAEIERVARLKLGKIQQRFLEAYDAELTYDEDLARAIAARCTEVETGARNIDHILTNTLLPGLSEEVLTRLAEESPFAACHLGLSTTGAVTYRFS